MGETGRDVGFGPRSLDHFGEIPLTEESTRHEADETFAMDTLGLHIDAKHCQNIDQAMERGVTMSPDAV